MSVYQRVRQQLVLLSQPEYAKFSSGLLPGTERIIGVRLPLLRKEAKQLVKEGCWQEYIEEFNCQYDTLKDSILFEEIMLVGMIIGLLKINKVSLQEILDFVSAFIPKIDNWSVCDSFCCSLKCVKSNHQFWWKWLQQFIFSSQEFEIRFGLVMLIFHFIDSNYLPQILNIIPNIKYDKYYSKMALAWLIAECYIKHPDLVINFLKNNNLSADVHNKAIQKICESKRIENKIKQQLKEIKK